MQDFMIALLTCSVTMSIIALLFMVVAPLLAKCYSEKGCYYAWLIIEIGLIIPFRPHFNNAIIKMNVPGETATPIIRIGNGIPVTMVIPIDNIVTSPAMPNISWWQIAAIIWLGGVIVFLACHVAKHYCFMKTARRWGEIITDEQALTLFQSLKTEMGISKRINLYLCSFAGSPMMIGFVKPRILLPKVDFTQEELCFILKHELIHYKRRDLWYKCLVLIATALHWFNPIVYLIAKAIDAGCELSCDDEVVRNMDADMRQRYSEIIISVVKYRSRLRTVLSTNFYGGKKGMKKRIFSIMDMSKKKTGFAIICGVLIVTTGTGFAYATNASSGALQANGNTTIQAEESVYEKAAQYEKYKSFGLIYDETTDKLYFNGKPIRYFEDWYPVDKDGNAYAGTDYFNENGIIDVHGVRDLSQIVHNTDGSYDPSGKLIGVEPYSQVEFDERDIEKFKDPPQIAQETASVSNDDSNSAGYYGGSDFKLSDDSRETFKIYAKFGLTYDDDGVFRYQEKTVRWFADLEGGFSFTRNVENDYNKSVDLIAIRDKNGNLTGLSAVGREEFDQRTERIEQSQREWEEFYQKHPNITSVSDISCETGEAYGSGQSVSGADEAYAASNDPDFVDTSLNNYINYGISYDISSKTWMFDGKPVSFLVDSGHQTYANYWDDNTDSNFAEMVKTSNTAFLKVIRKSNGSIDKIVEMTTDEAAKAINEVFN